MVIIDTLCRVMIVLVHLLSEYARILHHFSLTKMYRQQRRVVYQNSFAYDLALLFIMYVNQDAGQSSRKV